MATELEQLKNERHTCFAALVFFDKISPELETLKYLSGKDIAKTKLTSKVLGTFLDNFGVHKETIQKEHDRLNEAIIEANKR